MPEFETRKRKTMSEQELYREYHGEENAPKKASYAQSKNSSSKKRNPLGKESSSVSDERKRTREELRQKQTTAKKSKTYAGKTTGKAPKSSAASFSRSLPRSSASSLSHSSSRSDSRSESSSQSRSSSQISYDSRHNSSPTGSASRSMQKREQKKRSGRYTLYYVLIGMLAVITLTVLSTTVLFNIGVFVVSGETVYSDEEIIEACGIKNGENLLKINTGRAESSIVSKLVYIDSAKVHRGFPNRLTLSVTPAKPTVAFAFGGKYYVISERKRLLEISDTPLDCPVVRGVQMILQPKEEKNEAATADGDITNSPPTSAEGIVLENGAEEISVGAVLGDDNNNRIKLALSIAKLMAENGLTKGYEVNIADTLGVLISYDGHIQMELGTTAALDDKIYRASRIIEEDIGENENCTLNLTNPNRVVKRPVYESNEGGSVTAAPENVTEEETAAPQQ